MFSCSICQKEFETGPRLGGHASSHNRKPRTSKNLKAARTVSFCKFCSKEFKPKSIGAHTISCKLNPDLERMKAKRSITTMGQTRSPEQKQKMSDTVMRKIENGTWHLSFSKSRTHEYKGVKFHGTWEVKFAMYLDDKSVEWRRPIEKFSYLFGEKNRNYTPDFYIPELNSYIEIKGYQTPKDEAKWSQFPLKLIILKGEDLVKMGILEYNKVKKLAR